jgi:L-asparaginase II
MANNPVHVYRGEYLESTHMFHAAIVDQHGKLIHSYGDPNRPTFARSSMKPFQAIPLVETGAAYNFDYAVHELAISCASHSGEAIHRETVQGILNKINLPEDALQCGTHPPRSDEEYREHIRSGKDLTPVFSNCSGKHSGMLATAVFMGEDPSTYRQVAHPVQQRIIKVISEICDTPVEQIELGVDGCGVPVHRLPLDKTAFGYAQLAAGHSEKHPEHDQTLKLLREAMMARPDMVGGTNRFDTDIMELYPGEIVSKGGAEGVQCVGLVEQGLGIAIKMEDGSPRALSAITLKILEDLGFVGNEKNTELYKEYRVPAVQNMRKDRIGNITVDFELD